MRSRRRLAAALLVVAALLASRSPAQDLRAEQITRENVGRARIGGSDAVAGLGDYYLANAICRASSVMAECSQTYLGTGEATGTDG